MKLSQAVEDYIAYKRSLGMVFKSQAIILRAFSKSQGTVEVARVSRARARQFLNGRGPVTNFWFGKYGTLNGFFRFALARHYVEQSPLPISKPRPPETIRPHIYTDEEMKSLLLAAKLCRKYTLMEPHTLQILVLLLYAAGLRISEAVHLALADCDLKAGVLTIRASKFHKSRFVPIGRELQSVLCCYVAKQWSERTLPSTPLLGNSRAKPIARETAEAAFRRLCKDASISRPGGPRSQPRLHDLRHTFATMRLVTWYREGKDVQRLLPHLSTYLGHYKIRHTQHYLSMIPELLRRANRRFERYANSEVRHA